MYHNLFFNKKQFKTPCISTGRFKNKIIMRDLGLSSPSRRNQNARTCTGGSRHPLSKKRSVVMALEDCSHGGHRAVLPITFTKGKKKTLREFQQGITLADRNRRTRTPDSLNVSQLLYRLSYVPKSTRLRTWPDGYLVFEKSRFMAIRNQKPSPRWAFGFILII